MLSAVYADNAASTQLDPTVFDAMLPYLKEQYGNPSSVHRHGRMARLAVEQARKTIAKLLGATPAQIVFTGSGTEANNMAIASAAHTGCKTIITSPIVHHAVLHTVEHHAKQKGIPLNFVRLKVNGDIDLNDLQQHLHKSPLPALVSLMHANNELGNITVIEKVGELCLSMGAVYHADCVQTIGHLRIDAAATPVDFMSVSAHKFHGPKGTGLLYIKNPEKMNALIHGGGQERKHRSGTENVAGIVGMAKALELAMHQLDADQQHIQSLKTTLIEMLTDKIPGVAFNGDISHSSLYTVLNVSFPLTERTACFVTTLDMEGISVSGGSACTGGAASHVIGAIGAVNNRVAIRFSFCRYNTMEEIQFIIRRLDTLING